MCCKHSAESDTHKRDFVDEFNAARGKDKELMTDEEMAGTTTEAMTSIVPPHGGEYFWAKVATMLDCKLDAKVDQLGKNVAVALNAVENRLGERSIGEEGRRHRELLPTNQRIDDVIKRLEAIELRDNNKEIAAPEAGARGGGWKAQHLLLGFDTTLSREEAVKRAKMFLNNIGPEEEYAVDPYAPRKWDNM